MNNYASLDEWREVGPRGTPRSKSFAKKFFPGTGLGTRLSSFFRILRALGGMLVIVGYVKNQLNEV